VDTAVLVVVLTCIANLFLGLFVLLRNPKARLGQSFFAMALLISAWAVSNYFTENAISIDLKIKSTQKLFEFYYL
jgi:bacteriorhodopsin